MMKVVISLVLLAWCGGLACAQELRIPRPLNKDGKLVHDVAVYADDHSQQSEFSKQFLKSVKAKRFAVGMVDSLGEEADIVFVLGGAEGVIQEARNNYILPVAVCLSGSGSVQQSKYPVIQAESWKEAAVKAADLIGKMFYQGMRPRYSTIYENGKEGYHTYRIPSVSALPDGRIIAVTEARAEGETDCAENNILVKLSDDEGRSWGKSILVAESGESSLNNPAVVYVEELNRVIILFQEYPPKLHEGTAGVGVEGADISRMYAVYSDDRGETWSDKRDITREAKLSTVTGFASGPGLAIRVVSGPDKGRIIVPLNASGGAGGWFNYLVYSDDLGESWAILPGRSSYGTNESQVVQVSDTGFLVNARCHRFAGDDEQAPSGWNPWNFNEVTRYRGMIPVGIRDTNVSWGVTQVRRDMPDPLCQGAIYRYSGLKPGERSRILFSNPANQLTAPVAGREYKGTPPARINGTVRVSYDEGETWSYSKRIYGDRFTEFQYSVLVNLGNGKVGCIFEAFPEVRFAVFDMEWLTSGTDDGRK